MSKGESHYYVLSDGTKVESQKEACEILGIGKNAFRNRVKREIIKKITDKPKGYGKHERITAR